LQFFAAPDIQLPAVHLSPTVQLLPSLHVVPSGSDVFTHTFVSMLQTRVLHCTCTQLSAPAAQPPMPLQWSGDPPVPVHGTVSLQSTLVFLFV
jgi:hypothetical protein